MQATTEAPKAEPKAETKPKAEPKAPAFPLPCVHLYSKEKVHGPDPLVPWVAVVTGKGSIQWGGKTVPTVHLSAFVPADQQNLNGSMPVKAFRDIPIVEGWTPKLPTETPWPFPMFAVACK